MGNKGDIKTQQQYENEVELRELYREAYLRGEISQQKTFCSLVFTLGFGKTMAESLMIKWKQEPRLDASHNETPAAKKRREKRQLSLEKKCKARRNRGMSKETKKEFKKTQQGCSNCKYYNLCKKRF